MQKTATGLLGMAIALSACSEPVQPGHASDPELVQVAPAHAVDSGPYLTSRQFEPGSFTSADYGFTIKIPHGVKTCVLDAGGHPHGVALRLDSSDCDAPSSRYAMIWADYNSSFQTKAEILKSRGVPCAPFSRSIAWIEAAAIGQLETHVCGLKGEFGELEFRFVATAGAWSDSAQVSPRIVYAATLGTMEDHLEVDISVLQEFLGSFVATEEP